MTSVSVSVSVVVAVAVVDVEGLVWLLDGVVVVLVALADETEIPVVARCMSEEVHADLAD